MRRARTLATLVALVASDEDDSTNPEAPAYPAVAGTYAVQGTFDRVPAAGVVGTSTFTRASRSTSTIEGVSRPCVPALGFNFGTLPLTEAFVTRDGTATFYVGAATGTTL
jgi:hypothetical protein